LTAAAPLAVLLVDDDEVDRSAVRRALRRGGVDAKITEATDFASARTTLLGSGDFDVVLLDFGLPGGDGLELLREARSNGVDTPVIVLTGQGDEALAVQLMKAGASDYLPKGLLTTERLAQSVRQVLRLRDADRRARDAHRAVERQAVQLQRLANASVGIHGAQSLEAAMDFISRTARELIGAHVAVAQVDGVDGKGFVERRSLSEKYTGETSAPVDAAELRWATLVQETNKSLRFTNTELEVDSAWKAWCAKRFSGLTIRGLLAAPLVGQDGKALGSLQLTDRLQGDFDAGDEAMLVQLAQTASVALENARLYRAAQEAAATRDDVLAIVSHDLRNPLNVVGMSAALLRTTLDESPTPSAPRCAPLVQRIERNVTRMNRLIDDLLDASRVDTGKLSVRLKPEKASALVSDAVEAALPLAEAQQIRLQAVGLDTTLVVRADRDRILQVLSNLIGNSLKFVPKVGGAVTVSVGIDANRARFSVSDNGPGIPAEHAEHLFERYWKGANSSRDGAGLGLFIAKGILDAHGGEIRIANDGTPGATVRFWLHLA
jgi:signal transduction histidine kinase/DNA-binding NarL/FixJ family response regulator